MKQKRWMKKLTVFFLIGLISLSTYYYFAVYNSVKYVSASASFMGYSNVEDLTESADLVLKVTPTSNFWDREHVITNYDDGAVQDFYTLTETKVNEVFKGDIEQLSNLKFIEPISMIQTLKGKYKINIEGYQELEQGKEYIVFLGKNDAGQYSIINMDNGKFAVEEITNAQPTVTDNVYSQPFSVNSFSTEENIHSTEEDNPLLKEKLELEIRQKFFD
ncbi:MULTISPECIES: hypothetical protein [Saccharibacillus]|uniref:hypothetical protein n=1 Tax=Saccharibacillus TaxID=456492 RepID=UPI00123A848A|nr:hypothetical protein [Saccharibacillus sp. WB 17]MWJ32158.1 hypothetical protein [Saccharibacillus sp. WB 17]